MVNLKTVRQAVSRYLFQHNGKKHLKKPLVITAFAAGVALAALGLTTVISPETLTASDHDDGDIDTRSRALSLTDLYTFREIDQNPAARPDDIILVMNTNPRSLPRVQYFFSTQAQYEFRVTRVANKNSLPTANPDLRLQFTFGNPRRGTQAMTISAIERSGRVTTVNRTTSNRGIFSTPLSTAAAPTLNQVRLPGGVATVFAGLREDPFFFDVEQYFRVRAGALGTGPAVGFRSPDDAIDFTYGYNVNTIVVRIPRRVLQGSTSATTFDTWLSLSVRDPRTGEFAQMEQLARPGVNELLVINQRNYAEYNRSQPTRATPPTGIVNDVVRVLSAVGNSEERIGVILGAFLPDVMRIDTTIASGYGNAVNNRGSLIAGRKLADDVIDISLPVLTNGAITTDNVSYEGTPGNPAQGHTPLEPSFPYLAPPN